MRETRVVLIRHAEGRYRADRVVAGPIGCTGLSESGRRQAGRLRSRLARTRELSADVVVTSVLPRAVQTARAVAEALGVPVFTDCAYCEVHVGAADGLSYEEAGRRWGWPGPWREPPEGGETVAQFGDRVVAGMAALTQERRHRTTLLVTHGGFISAACHWFLGVPWQPERSKAERRFFLDPSHTGITEWTRAEDQPWVLVRYNDVAHLRL